jgi:hypothetical protein
LKPTVRPKRTVVAPLTDCIHLACLRYPFIAASLIADLHKFLLMVLIFAALPSAFYSPDE